MIQFLLASCIFIICHFHQMTAYATYELAIISMFRNEAPYLKEWIEYHQLVGVEHFWLYNNGSTDNWEEILKPYINKGLVEVFYKPLANGPTGSHVPLQIKSFKEGLNKAKDQAKWVALLDIDEFLLPMQEKTVTECLNTHFKDASAIYVNWLHFGTSQVVVPLGEPLLTQLTACSLTNHHKNGVGKSIVRPNHISIEKIWFQHHFPLMPTYKYVNGDGEILDSSKSDLRTDGKHHAKYIRLNHYALRDENFFHNVRLKRRSRKGQVPLWLDNYQQFSLSQDFAIIDFLKNKHSKKYKNYWGKYQ